MASATWCSSLPCRGAGSEPVGHHPGLPIGHSRRRSALLPAHNWAGTLDVPVRGYYVYGPGAGLWLGLAMLVTMPLGALWGCGEPGAPGAPASRAPRADPARGHHRHAPR
jgi:hypothetical protein